jgi:hypothetical protein
MPFIKIPLLLFTLFICFFLTSNAQTNNLVGVGFSSHNSAITNLTVNNYLTEESSSIYGSPTNFNTPHYSLSINYGRVLSPSVIFFTGIEKSGMGHQFVVTLLEIHSQYNNPPGTPAPTKSFTETKNDIELELNYLKIPLTLYWKWMKDKPFGMFTSFGIDVGVLTSATLTRDGVNTNYKEKLNSRDINYKFKLGVRYDTEKYLANLSLGFGNGFSDVEDKEKIGVTTPTPSHNTLIGCFLSLNRKF